MRRSQLGVCSSACLSWSSWPGRPRRASRFTCGRLGREPLVDRLRERDLDQQPGELQRALRRGPADHRPDDPGSLGLRGRRHDDDHHHHHLERLRARRRLRRQPLLDRLRERGLDERPGQLQRALGRGPGDHRPDDPDPRSLRNHERLDLLRPPGTSSSPATPPRSPTRTGSRSATCELQRPLHRRLADHRPDDPDPGRVELDRDLEHRRPAGLYRLAVRDALPGERRGEQLELDAPVLAPTATASTSIRAGR